MTFNLPFATSEIIIGSDNVRIFISNSGDMMFIDGSLKGSLKNGVSLSKLAGQDSLVELEDIIDTSDTLAGKSYYLLKNPDGSWKAVDAEANNLSGLSDVTLTSLQNNDTLRYIDGSWVNYPGSINIIIQVESDDWTYNDTVIDGDPGYSLSVNHNLNLTLPNDLLDVSIWNLNNEKITLHKVKQQTNSIYLESTVNLNLYTTMRTA